MISYNNDEDAGKTPLPYWAWPARMGNGIVFMEVEVILIRFPANTAVDGLH